MKKILTLFLVFLLLAVMPVAAAAQAPLVADTERLLTQSQAQELERQLEMLRQTYAMDVAVVTVYSLEGEHPETYAREYYLENGYGYGAGRDGFLLLISMEYRDWALLPYGAARQVFTLDGQEYIADQILPTLSAGEYGQAFICFAELCGEFLEQAAAGEAYDGENLPKGSFDLGKYVGISLAVGFGVALVAVLIMAAQLRSVRAKAGAGDYVRSGSLQITRSNDLYLYSTVSRSPRPKSGSSGGSRHGGSSGKF